MTDRPDQGVLDGGVATYMGAPLLDPYEENELAASDPDVAFLGFPFDGASVSRTGANRGPRAIRDASSQSQYYHFEYDVHLDEEYSFVDVGDVPVVPGNPERSIKHGADLFGRLLDTGAVPVMAGGDHVVTTAGTRALGKRAENPALISLDTHLDISEEYLGERYNHCCPVARTIDEGGFEPENISILGLSAYNFEPDLEAAIDMGVNLFTLDEIARNGAIDVAREAVEAATADADAVYLTVDIDVLDAGAAPGTGVPTLGGMQPREFLQILGVVAASGIDAMDIVEVSPQLDQAGITARMAARTISDSLAANAVGTVNAPGSGTEGSKRCRMNR